MCENMMPSSGSRVRQAAAAGNPAHSSFTHPASSGSLLQSLRCCVHTAAGTQTRSLEVCVVVSALCRSRLSAHPDLPCYAFNSCKYFSNFFLSASSRQNGARTTQGSGATHRSSGRDKLKVPRDLVVVCFF